MGNSLNKITILNNKKIVIIDEPPKKWENRKCAECSCMRKHCHNNKLLGFSCQMFNYPEYDIYKTLEELKKEECKIKVITLNIGE